MRNMILILVFTLFLLSSGMDNLSVQAQQGPTDTIIFLPLAGKNNVNMRINVKYIIFTIITFLSEHSN